MIISVCTTTETREEAKAIARACVEAGVVACAHLDEIESCFFWDGSVQEEREIRLMLKTTDESYDQVEQIIQTHHSYDEPAIYVLPIPNGSESYLQWVRDHSNGTR